MRSFIAAAALFIACPVQADVDVFAALEAYADAQPAVPKRTIFQPPAKPAPKPVQRQLITSPRWLENGHGATVGHLISAHGFTRAQLAGLSQRQLDDLHSDAHNRARSRTVTRTTSACPSGNCPNTSVRRGVFRRR